MLDAPVLSHLIAGNANAPSPALVCSWTDGGLDAAWVRAAGELNVETLPELDRTLRVASAEGEAGRARSARAGVHGQLRRARAR